MRREAVVAEPTESTELSNQVACRSTLTRRPRGFLRLCFFVFGARRRRDYLILFLYFAVKSPFGVLWIFVVAAENVMVMFVREMRSSGVP